MINENHSAQVITAETYQQSKIVNNYQAEIIQPQLDLDYMKTLSGMLKCICIALDFLCFICILVGGPAYFSGAGWATFVCIFGMLISLTLLVLYLFHIVDLFQQIPWILIFFVKNTLHKEMRYHKSFLFQEMIFCFAWAIFFFLCGCVLAIAAAKFHGVSGYGAASFFAFGALCAYGFDSYLKFLAWRHDEVARGGIGTAEPFPYHTNSYNTTVPPTRQRKVVINEPMQI
ncbi:unnamed protein product [Thelazia callipaeda]|uniref:MARVEL domain-containing protein n=1 Tax=Thelazia callipaeda TaxID=103827 RepID=A0A0N5DC33_THECL|nr:unnamed protein product [Thelazia callipaeda]